MKEIPVKKIYDKPSNSNGYTYHPDCCAKPDIWRYTDGEIRCKVCGYGWTEKIETNY